jgi:serine/threonine protein kinase
MWSCTFHENMIKLVGYTLEPEYLIVTKLYEIDLFTLIHHPNEPISPLLAFKLSNDIAAAMSYCQSVGIVHRDLKSSNVLLEQVPINQTQSILKAVVCDFGLARVTTSANTLDNLKLREIGGFSPRYAAPEVLSSFRLQTSTDPEVDKKSDVYSFAIIIWELLVRKIPWDGYNGEQIEQNVRAGMRPDVPKNDDTDQARTILIDLMQACWQDAPATRPSFQQIHSKLSALL